jgi:membrane-associated phospholipid phosphatase
MEMVQAYSKWSFAVKAVSFRRKLAVGLVMLLGVVLLLPSFFQFAENREGYHINDRVLNVMAPRDMSIPIVICIWSLMLLFVFRSYADPQLFLLYLYGFLLLCLCRFITIGFVPLDPPEGLLDLKDPISNYFYGTKTFITKDLFFSGHTATLVLLAFCFKRKWDKAIAIVGALAVGILVLVQHIHYTIDVIAAPFFSWLCYLLAKGIVNH